ncbi:MAG: hypothetical protein ACFFCZ_22020 [Promethearchaeota archaeon]
MKRKSLTPILLSILIIFSSPCIGAFSISYGGSEWTLTEVISTESTSNSFHPIIAVNDTLHVIWVDETDYLGAGTDADIFYKRSKSSTTEVISTESTSDSLYPNVKIGTHIYVTWVDYTDYLGAGTDADIFYKHTESSTTWTTTEVISTESTADAYSPILASNQIDQKSAVWVDETDYLGAGTDADIFFKHPNDTLELVSTESTSNSDTPSLVNKNNVIHIAWVDRTDYLGAGTDADIFYKRWNATSGTWTPTEVVSTESTSNSYTPALAVDYSGNIHITWADYTDYLGAGTDADIFYKRWNATSGTWTPAEVVSTESTSNSYTPALAVDYYEEVHIVWADESNYAGAGTDRDIFYKTTTMGTWTPAEVVSTESTSNSYTPALAVDYYYEEVHIVWEDWTEYDDSGTDADIFYKKLKRQGPTAATPGFTWLIISTALWTIALILIINKDRKVRR